VEEIVEPAVNTIQKMLLNASSNGAVAATAAVSDSQTDGTMAPMMTGGGRRKFSRGTPRSSPSSCHFLVEVQAFISREELEEEWNSEPEISKANSNSPGVLASAADMGTEHNFLILG
jgi:hypothetical protein